ncbi:MAG: sigma-70 family RNA polymerase sigma factor [Gemmatimonadales bacterium]|nr:sigma-70 family RNA polymerase sigma factor [Gemmatimonadales bacterium]
MGAAFAPGRVRALSAFQPVTYHRVASSPTPMGASLPPELARLLEAAAPASREQAWDDFVAAYSRLLLHTARSVAHDHDAAMDAYAYMLEALRDDGFRRLRAYQSVTNAKFTTWLVVVVRRLCLDHRRQRYGRTQSANPDAGAARRRLAELVGEDVDAAQIPDTAVGPVAVLEERERSRLLESCREKLDPRDRLLLKLRFEDDLPARAIAEVLGFASAFHVYRRLDKVTAALRDCLRRRGVTGPA